MHWKGKSPTPLCSIVFSLIILVLGTPAPSSADEPAFFPLPDGEVQQLNGVAWAQVKQSRVRNRVVTGIHHARINPSLTSPHMTVSATLLFLVAPGTQPVKVVIDRQETDEEAVTWHGHVPGDANSSAYIVVDKNGESLFGDIRIQGRIYQIRPTDTKAIVSIYTLDPRQFPPDHPSKNNAIPFHRAGTPLPSPGDNTSGSPDGGTSPGGPTGAEREAASAVTGGGATFELTIPEQPPLIDMMILYTPPAKAQAGIPDIIAREVCQVIREIRDSFIHSAVKPIIRLVHHGVIDMAESYSGPADTRLNFMRQDLTKNAQAKALRNQYSADVVSLWISDAIFDGLGPNAEHYCGMSPPAAIPTRQKNDPESAFSVVLESCLSNRSATHEFGHILGSHDDRLGTGGSQYDTSPNYGYVLPMKGWRTIMGLDRTTCLGGHCNRLNFWSNPTVSYPSGSGDAAGVPTNAITTSNSGPAYNALVFNDTLSVVEGYRSPPKPISGLGNVSCGIVADLTPNAPVNLNIR